MSWWSSQSSDIYDIVYDKINEGQGYFSTGQFRKKWPETDGYTKEQFMTVIDNYRELVANKKYPLPNSNDNVRKLSTRIKELMGLPKASTIPTNAILSMVKYLGTDEPSLYNWAYPGQITPPPDEQNPFLKALGDVKTIAIIGIIGYVLIQTGALKKIFK